MRTSLGIDSVADDAGWDESLVVVADAVEAVVGGDVFGVDEATLLHGIVALDGVQEVLVGHLQDLTVRGLDAVELADLVWQAVHERNDGHVGGLKKHFQGIFFVHFRSESFTVIGQLLRH